MKPYSPKPTLSSEASVQSNSLAEAWLTSSSHLPSQLPTSAGELVGREDDLQILNELLQHNRLVTLVGPGGVGKSRLAQQLAWNSRPYYRDGVFWISLTGVRDPQYLIPMLTEALGITFSSNLDPGIHLIDYLSNRQALLIVDNFEYVLNAAPFLAEVVNRTAAITLLVTSRERLNLYEEWVYEVNGLSVPDDEATSSSEVFKERGAIALFLQRTRQLGVNLPLNDTTMHALVRLCHLVDGLPLALELAAVWVRAMSVHDIVREIERSLDFLDQGWYNSPPHQRSLRRVFEHSWQRLSVEERQVCSRLAFFQGGIRRATAQHVAEATPAVLAALVDKSFLQWASEQERYSFHPVLRQYAAEKLAEQPVVVEELGTRQCVYFTGFLHEQMVALRQHGQPQALSEIVAEIENIQQAWEWATQHGPEPLLKDSLIDLFQYYLYRGQLHAGLAVFARAAGSWLDKVNGCKAALPEVGWRLLARQAMFEVKIGRSPAAQALLQECAGAFRAMGNRAETVLCLNELGQALASPDQLDQAQSLLEESLSLAQAARLVEPEADAWKWLGAAHLSRYQTDKAETCHEQALHLYRQIGQPQGEGQVLTYLMLVFIYRNEHVRARAYGEQALAIYRRLGNPLGESKVLTNLGIAYQYQGRYTMAEKYYRQATALGRSAGYRTIEGVGLVNCGQVNQLLGDFLAAREISLQAFALFETAGFSYGMVHALYNLGGIAHDLQDDLAAQDYACQLLTLAQKRNDGLGRIYALKIMGQACLELQHPAEARAALQQAIALGRELNQMGQILPAMADLARVYQAQGDLISARTQVEEILKYQGTPTLEEDEDDPCRVYLVCYQILKAGQDPRALAVLQMARRIVQERAAHIDDESRRRSFLENVTAHREILAEAAAHSASADISSNEPQSGTLVEPLTSRELDVLRLMAKGLSNDEIAERLVLGRATIKSHAHRLFAKLDVRNRTQAVQRARELKLL